MREEGIVSYLLASSRSSGARFLTTSLVEIGPGGEQRLHSHEPEQVYFILEGIGQMTVGAEVAPVGPGDCVFIASGQPHGLQNEAGGPLMYFSAAAPTFSPEQLAQFWPLNSEAEDDA